VTPLSRASKKEGVTIVVSELGSSLLGKNYENNLLIIFW
jgi:hypothetical protein